MNEHDLTRRQFIAAASASSLAAVASITLPAYADVTRKAGKLAILGGDPASASAAAQPWWEREGPLTILDDGSSYTGVVSPSPDMDLPLKASLAFNTEHMHVMGMAGGLDDQEFFFSSKVAGKKNQDYLAKYMPEAKKRGLRVIVYFDVHWFKSSLGDQHPDWRQIQEGGGTISDMYGQPSTSVVCHK